MQTTQTYQAWFEKHRPKNINDLIFPNVLNGENKDSNYVAEIFKNFYNNEFVQGNVLSYGPAGFGKTSLNKILQSKIIKHPNDIYILDRTVDSVDKLKTWVQQKPAQSRQKLVIIEEMDRLSNQAQIVLKDGLLEKYQNRVSFLATSNNPEKIDNALITRFNLRLHFNDLNEEQAIQRMIKILEDENINYQNENVNAFVKMYIKRGLREMISNLEVNSITGAFVFDPKKALNLTGNEDYIIKTVVYLISYLKQLQKEQTQAILSNTKSDGTFAQYYDYILKLIKEDLMLNYEYIYKSLMDNEYVDFGSSSIIIDDYQIIDQVKMKNFHFLGTFSKLLKDIADRKNLS